MASRSCWMHPSSVRWHVSEARLRVSLYIHQGKQVTCNDDDDDDSYHSNDDVNKMMIIIICIVIIIITIIIITCCTCTDRLSFTGIYFTFCGRGASQQPQCSLCDFINLI